MTNFGTTFAKLYGVYLMVGGTVTNGAADARSASIQGWRDGVYLTSGVGRITNYGTISGQVGVQIGNRTAPQPTAATIENFGVIQGKLIGSVGAGVWLEENAAATITNFGTIKGGVHVRPGFGDRAGRTLVNSGTIIGGS